MKKLIIPALAILLLLTGCGKTVPKLENGQEKVVSLENGAISVDELYEEMKSKYALNTLINLTDEKLLGEKYPSNSEEKDYIKEQTEIAQTYYNQFYYQSYSTFESYISAAYGVETTAELEEVFALSYKRTKAIEDYAKSLVTDSEIQSYYDDKVIGDIEASHILITAEYTDSATDEEKATAEENAKKKAEEIIEKLNNGEDFATLAKENSKDGSAANGGALGKFNRGQMVQEFEDAAIELEVGEYSKTPVKTQYGYHIILKTAQDEKPALENVKDTVIETLAEEKASEDEYFNYKALIEIRKNAGFTIEDTELNKQYENYVYNVSN